MAEMLEVDGDSRWRAVVLTKNVSESRKVDCGWWEGAGATLGNVMAELARSFRELRVYRLARDAAKAVFEVSRTFPREETYSLTDQIRRSARATKNLIPEAWAKRRYPAAFSSKLTDALGEAMETQAWLDDALDARYITEETHAELNARFQGIGGMLNSMITGARSFMPAEMRRAGRSVES